MLLNRFIDNIRFSILQNILPIPHFLLNLHSHSASSQNPLHMNKKTTKFSLFFVAAFTLSFAQIQAQVTTFNFTGSVQTYTVPAGVTSIQLETWGAQGQGGNGGNGGYARGTMSVTPGQVLNLYVGGQAGYNGGGLGHAAVQRNGGGASDVRVSPYALANRVLVAGGGGGGGPTDVGIRAGGTGGGGTVGPNYVGGGGGAGYGGNGLPGGATGGAGNTSCHSGGGGGGGFTSGGGAACNTCYTSTCGTPGTLGQGGNGDTWENGICFTTYGGTNGGGGGYYGGGGSSVGNCGGGGGGGGSSFVGTLTSTLMTAGIRTGNGQIVITVLNGINVTQNTQILCSGQANASLTAAPFGGQGPYTYSWAPSGGTAATATGLAAGVYTVTVTDANSVVTTQTFNVTQPAALASTTMQTNISCNGGSNGDAMVMVTGGTGAYTYSWAPSGGNAATAMSLTAGTYTCLITDANSCTLTQTFNVTQPAALAATTMQTNISCNGGNNGDAMVMVTGGTGAYTYAWTPSGGNAATAMSLTAGTYTCLITDANSCTLTQTFNITEPAALASTTMQTNLSCNGDSNGDAMVMVTGGTGAYTYAWTPSGGNAATAMSLTAGTYTCLITDANSCTLTQTFNITEPAALASTTMQTNLSCNGDSNGDAMVTVTGGTGAYSYAWTPSGGNADMATGLTAGIYTCTITDANSCTLTQTFSITEPSAITVTSSQNNVLCSGGSTGNATVNATGGAGSYTYSWSPSGGTAATATGLSAGAYVCTITDANGCTTSASVSIAEPSVLNVSVTTTTGPTSCFGMDGSINITVAGGTGPYSYAWSNGPTSEDMVGLVAASYTGTITDANGCTTVVTVTLTDPNAPTVTLSLGVTTVCADDANVTLTGGSPAGGVYTGTAVSGGVFNPSTTNIGANTITYTYTDPNTNCSATATGVINVNACVGIADPETAPATFTVTPNPNNGTFMLQLNTTQTADVIIYDAIGQVVSKQKLQPGVQNEISIATAGVYSITVITADGKQSTQRVIVNK
jgi:SprB repeat/Secretion system C-terminal sorting domain/Glycine rich protein